MWLTTCGSTASCRSAKHRLQQCLIRGRDGYYRQRAQTRAQVWQAHGELSGRRARGEQHRRLVLTHQVQQVKERALVADPGMQVLDQQRTRPETTAALNASPLAFV
jgi:hypothetical protein